MMKKYKYSLLLGLFFYTAVRADLNNIPIEKDDVFNLFIKNTIEELKEYSALDFKGSGNNSFALIPQKAQIIQKAFEENELAATKKYENQPIRLNVKIERVTTDILGNAVITEKNSKSLISNAFRIKNSDDNKLLSLKKGDTLDLTCLFEDFSLGTVSFKKCEFTTDYTNQAYDLVLENLQHSSYNNWKPTSKIAILLKLLYTTNQQEIEKLCNDKSKCALNMKNNEHSYLYNDKLGARLKAVLNDDKYKNLPRLPIVD